MFVTANIGMPKEKFEALPDSEQVKIMIESTTRAKAKYREGEQQIYTLMNGSAADGVKAVERIPALKAALGKSRLSAREFIPAYRAYHWAMGYVLGEEFGPGKPLPPGVRQENVTLFRAMSKSEPLWTLLGLTKS
jgi:hypothetical protein